MTEAVGAGTGTSRATTLARAGLIVTLAFLVSRVLGWVRVAVISTQFGATGELDAATLEEWHRWLRMMVPQQASTKGCSST